MPLSAPQFETFHLSVCGRNVTVRLDERLSHAGGKRGLGPLACFEAGGDSRLRLTLRHGKGRRAYVEDDFQRITYYRSRIGSHIIRQLVCLLAAWHSREWDIVHGTGLLVASDRNEGLLLVGPAGYGKSTLSRELGNFIMDDDLMLVQGERMRVTGKLGFVTCVEPGTGRKMLRPLPAGRKEAALALVLILDKSQPGGTYWELDNSIPRRLAVLEDLPPILKDAYLRLPPVRVDAPIYRLGTRGRLRETVALVRHLADQHI